MKQKYADLLLLAVTFIWGTTFVIVQKAVAKLAPFSFNGWRFLFAGLLLWAIIALLKRPLQWTRQTLLNGALMGLFLFAGYAFQTFGLLYTSTSNAGFITGLSVVLVPMFMLFVFKQKPSLPAIFGVGLAAVGLYSLTGGNFTTMNYGDALVLGCAISFACQIVVTSYAAAKSDVYTLALVQILTVALCSFIGALWKEDTAALFSVDVILQRDVLIALIITAALATTFAFIVQTSVQRFTSATRVAIIFATEPVFAALTGYFFNDERLSVYAYLGCTLILAGMLVAEWPTKKATAE